MMEQQTIRGRPRGQLTIAKRKVLVFVMQKQAANENYTLGQVSRVCGFNDRSNANKVLKALRKMGLI